MTGTFSPPKLYDHEKRLQSMRDAAPELYEAGSRILECIDHPKARNRQLDIDALRAALAKARGVQP